MNGAKRILISLRITNLLHSTRLTRNHSLYSQVTISSPSLSPPSFTSSIRNNLHYQFYSSKPSSLLELILTNDWSEKLEHEISNLNPIFTHETVVYILKKIDKDPEKSLKFFNWVCDKYGFRPISAAYSLVLRVLANKESMKQFWVVIKNMKEQGCYIDEGTFKTIRSAFSGAKLEKEVVALNHFYNRMVQDNALDNMLKNVVQIVNGSDWGNDVEQQLGKLQISLSENSVIRVLMELRRSPLKSLKFFRWVSESLKYEHNSITYNAMLRVLSREDSIPEFWSMVGEMKKEGHEIDLDTYIKISRFFKKNKMFKDAVEFYELMMNGPYKPSVQDCSALLRTIALCNNPDLDLVFRVVKKYEEAGNSLSKAVYDGIHRSLTSVGRFDEAEKIVETMKNAGYEPDNITYSQLVYGLCKAKRLEEAREMLDQMEVDGCVPDLKTWTILIQGHCAADELDQALLCLAKMMEKNCDADSDLMDILVNGFLSQKKIVGAYKLLVEMADKARIRPWQATYKNLIQGLLEERKLEEAMNLLRLMKKHNYPPFPEPFVQYISKFGTVEDAGDFLKALTVNSNPSVSAYLHVFQSFFQEGREYEAKDLLYKCPHHIRKHKAISDLFGSANAAAGV